MPSKEYQPGYSGLHPETTYDFHSRERKARTMLAVLADRFEGRLSDLHVLDTGVSTGIIANTLAEQVGRVTGLDIDDTAVAFARRTFQRPNLHFLVGDSLAVPCPPATFDVAICTHVYEHVPNADRLPMEIHRVLKPGGWCYFAAGNRLNIMEPHYGLPFLSWLPRPLAHRYLRLAGQGDYYYEKHLTLAGLRRLTAAFRCTDYTRKIIANPAAFHAEYMLPSNSLKTRLASLVAGRAFWLMPSYIWMLQKRK